MTVPSPLLLALVRDVAAGSFTVRDLLAGDDALTPAEREEKRIEPIAAAEVVAGEMRELITALTRRHDTPTPETAMRAILATLLCALALPAAADDRYAGRYSADCGRLVCELTIQLSAPDAWRVLWAAYHPQVLDAEPACAFTTTAEIGSARLGPAGVVEGIAVGKVRGRPFGIFDLDAGRVSWSSAWEACPGVAPKGVYSAFGDE